MGRAIALVLAFSLSAGAWADTLILKDGRKIVGKVLKRGPKSVSFEVISGGVRAVVSYEKSEIKQIKNSPVEADPRPEAKKPSGDRAYASGRLDEKPAHQTVRRPASVFYFRSYGAWPGYYHYGYPYYFRHYFRPVVILPRSTTAFHGLAAGPGSQASSVLPHGPHPMEDLNYRFYRSGPAAVQLSFRGLQWSHGVLPPVTRSY